MTYKLTNFFVICDETMTFTAWHTADLDSAPKNYTETIHKVLFLKNAYRTLSRWIFPFLALSSIPTSYSGKVTIGQRPTLNRNFCLNLQMSVLLMTVVYSLSFYYGVKY